ncbi:MAG: Gfo/Idh/MocA family oxidoreductase [Deltaproteobacteria bacterium]|nr:Gfo/Idh/MocA family oxidoreductase [Deltaproteobacteria bacterium]MBW2069986.1 Gfo/Idh/MocA family oxidoreductase [Deltaproteobacteria bacterium]
MIHAADRAGIAIVCKEEQGDFLERQFPVAPACRRASSRGEEQAGNGLPPRIVSGGQQEKISVAVVGVGYLGKFHTEKYASLPDAELVAVVDIDEARACQVAKKFSCQPYFSHQDIIGRVEAVSVVTPTKEHYHIARDLLEAGIHVLVEKPMTVTLPEADILIELARERDLTLQVGHLERFNPAVVTAREHVQQPLFVESHRLASFTERGTEVNVILDLMIHDIDIILSLLSSSLKDLHAVGVRVLTRHIDIASVRLEFTDGCIANLTASRISAKKMRKIRIFQPDSYISLDYAARKVELFRKLNQTGSDGLPEIEYQRLQVADVDPLQEELRAFLHSVRSGEPPVVSGKAGRDALELATLVSDEIQQRTKELSRVLGLAGEG